MSALLSSFIRTHVSRNSSVILSRCCYSTGPQQNGSLDLNNWTSDECQFLHRSNVRTMFFQKSLLRLPVPELEKTCSRYLLSQKALLSPEEYLETEKLVQEFEKGSGVSLQEKLKATDKQNKHTNYISKDWFDMYLKDRASVVLNYNPFMAFLPPEGEMVDPVVRATNILTASARFLRTLRLQILEPEVYHLNPAKSDTAFFRKLVGWTPEMFASYVAYAQKAFPLDMSQFGNLLNSSRIPQIGRDTFTVDDSAKHILVMKNGNFYVFDILDGNGNIYPPSHLYSCMSYIHKEASERPSHPLGYLTSENRDTWAKVRQELLSAGNADSLSQVDHAAFNIAFDNHSVGMDPEVIYRTFLYGDGGNRWFDKSFSLLFTEDAMTALNFEHGWGDGVAVMRYFNEIAKDTTATTFVSRDTPKDAIDPSQYVRKLEWKLTPSIEQAVDSAKSKYEKATSALGVNVFETDIMNKVFCKKHKLSPDAIMQLGFQVAYKLQYGGVAATYESCSTSAFKHGRTETMRPATLETNAFSDAVCGAGASSADLKALIKACSNTHGELTKNAAMGQGFDRHLFGLRKVAEREGGAMPPIFQDPNYAKMNHIVISTSTLPSNLISLGGFAPVTRDGFGVGYQINDEKMGLIVSTYPPARDGKQFVEAAEKAYHLIRDAIVR